MVWSAAEVLAIRGLRKVHHGVAILEDVDLTVRAGEVLGVVGVNGVGKSTLMSIIAGDYPPDAGTMTLDGEPFAPTSTEEARAAGVGIVRQRVELDPTMTVAQAIYRMLPIHDHDDAELERRAGALLRRTGVTIDPRASIAQLERAEHGMVEAVRMIAENARIIVMDEVAAIFNADEITRLHFISLLLAQRGCSIIYVSHRLHEVVQVAHRIAVLRGGAITVELNPRRVVFEDLANEMLDYEPGDRIHRDGHVGEAFALRVRGVGNDKIHDVDLDLRRGEVIGLIGPRGAGMDALARTLAGRLPASTGEFEVFGTDRRIESVDDAERLRIAYLGDNDDEIGVTGSATVASNLGAADGATDATFAEEVETMRRAVEQVRRLRIRTPGIHQRADLLSGGDFHKIALQRWVDEGPDIVIMNQPTRGLDIAARNDFFAMLAAHTSAGRSALLLTTELDELTGWCDRIATMRDGRITGVHTAAALSEEELLEAMSHGSVGPDVEGPPGNALSVSKGQPTP